MRYLILAAILFVSCSAVLAQDIFMGPFTATAAAAGEDTVRFGGADSALTEPSATDSVYTLTTTVPAGTNEYSVFGFVEWMLHCDVLHTDSVTVDRIAGGAQSKCDSLTQINESAGNTVGLYGAILDPGSHTFKVFNGRTGATTLCIVMGAAHFFGVNQTTPATSSTNGTATSATAHVAIANTLGNWAVDLVETSVGPRTLTPKSPSAIAWTEHDLDGEYAVMAYKNAADTADSCTINTSTVWRMLATSVQKRP